MTQIQSPEQETSREPIQDMAFFVEYLIKNRTADWVCRNGQKAVPNWERFKVAEKLTDRAGAGVLATIPFSLCANILVTDPAGAKDIEIITFEHTTMRANIIIQDGDQAINLVSRPDLQSEWDIVGFFSPEMHQKFKNAEKRHLQQKAAQNNQAPTKPKTKRKKIPLKQLQENTWATISGKLNENGNDFMTDNLFILKKQEKIMIVKGNIGQKIGCAAIAICKGDNEEISLTEDDLQAIQVIVDVAVYDDEVVKF